MTLRTSGTQILIENAAGVTKFNSSDKLVFPRAALIQTLQMGRPSTDNSTQPSGAQLDQTNNNLLIDGTFASLNAEPLVGMFLQNRETRHYCKILDWLSVGQEFNINNDFIEIYFTLIASQHTGINTSLGNKRIPFNNSIIIAFESTAYRDYSDGVNGYPRGTSNAQTFLLNWQLYQRRKILLTITKVDPQNTVTQILSDSPDYVYYPKSYRTVSRSVQYARGYRPEFNFVSGTIDFKIEAKLYSSL